MSIPFFNERKVINALRVLIAVGILLAIYQYWFNRSLWIDEASLALNIINKSYAELLHPLDYLQVAPIGFLVVEKLFVNIFGANEYALRLFPLLSFFTSVFLYFKLSRELLDSKLLAFLAVALFSIGISSIYYASEVKQYSIEVLMCLATILSSLKLNPASNKSLLAVGLIGAISVWFSSTAIIILCTSAIYLFFKHVVYERKLLVLLLLFLWGASFLTYYFIFINGHSHIAYMQDYWADSFFPLSFDLKAIYDFVHRSLNDIYAFHLRYGVAWIVPAFISMIGMICLAFDRRFKILSFLLLPTLIHVILSALELYPYSGRLILYLIPLYILLYTWGLYYVWKFVDRRLVKVPVEFISIVVVLAFVPIVMRLPMEKQEVKASIAMIADHIEDGDNVYVFGAAKRAFQFYDEKDALLKGNTIGYGKTFKIDTEASLPDIKKFHGTTWLLFGHHGNSIHRPGHNPVIMIDLLEANGYSVLSETEFTGCSVYQINDDDTLMH